MDGSGLDVMKTWWNWKRNNCHGKMEESLEMGRQGNVQLYVKSKVPSISGNNLNIMGKYLSFKSIRSRLCVSLSEIDHPRNISLSERKTRSLLDINQLPLKRAHFSSEKIWIMFTFFWHFKCILLLKIMNNENIFWHFKCIYLLKIMNN